MAAEAKSSMGKLTGSIKYSWETNSLRIFICERVIKSFSTAMDLPVTETTWQVEIFCRLLMDLNSLSKVLLRFDFFISSPFSPSKSACFYMENHTHLALRFPFQERILPNSLIIRKLQNEFSSDFVKYGRQSASCTLHTVSVRPIRLLNPFSISKQSLGNRVANIIAL